MSRHWKGGGDECLYPGGEENAVLFLTTYLGLGGRAIFVGAAHIKGVVAPGTAEATGD